MSDIKKYVCECGKRYMYEKRFKNHKKTCKSSKALEGTAILREIEKHIKEIRIDISKQLSMIRKLETEIEVLQSRKDSSEEKVSRRSPRFKESIVSLDDAFKERCISELDKRDIYSLEDIVNVFIVESIRANFNYVIRDISRNIFAYYLGDRYCNDVKAVKAIGLVREMIDRAQDNIRKKINITNVKLMNAKLSSLSNIKTRSITSLLKDAPTLSYLDTEEYKEEYRKRYSL